MRTQTSMRIRFDSKDDTSLYVQIHPHVLRIVRLEGAAIDSWKEALSRRLKREPTDKDITKYIGKIHIKAYDPDTKLPDYLKQSSLVKLYLDDRQGQTHFWKGEVATIEGVCVTITH